MQYAGYTGGRGGGGTRSRLCNSGRHNLELYNNFSTSAALKKSSSLKYGKISFLAFRRLTSTIVDVPHR